MFLTGKCWEHWSRYFGNLGYQCDAPSWPLHDGEPADLRSNIPPELGSLRLRDVFEHYLAIVAKETAPVILVGHSVGGLIVQKLISAGYGVAGICIASVAPNKMLALDWSFLKTSASIANPLAGSATYEMTADGFHESFCNSLSKDESSDLYHRYATHESRQVFRDVMGEEGHINLEQPHPPLLFIGAMEDSIIPDSLVRRNAHAYTDDRSHHEYTSFSGRSHFLIAEPRWEEIAERTANWLEGHLTATRS